MTHSDAWLQSSIDSSGSGTSRTRRPSAHASSAGGTTDIGGLLDLWGKAEQQGVRESLALTEGIAQSSSQRRLTGLFVWFGDLYRSAVTTDSPYLGVRYKGVTVAAIAHPDPRKDGAVVYGGSMTIEAVCTLVRLC